MERKERNSTPSHVFLLFLKALSTPGPLETHLHSCLPQMRCVGPGESSRARKQVCPCTHFRGNHPFCHPCISSVHCFISYEGLSQAWYHFILPSACEVDYRNLITDEEERHREFAQLAQGHTAVEWSHQGSYKCLMIPRAGFPTTSKQPPHQNELVNSPHV